ncbi:MAG: aspartyl protease family protein [Xanthomonadaceae bacterium]|nr:aspartyl protease family protein [Xanthomonadaceae bacterium]
MARLGSSAILAIAWIGLCACAQRPMRDEAPTARRAPHEKAYDIPFVLTAQNNLVVEAMLDEATPLRLMLHTAASDVSLTEEAVRKIPTLRFGDTAEIGSWGGPSDARFSAGHRLTLGGATRENVTVWEVKDSGDGTDGKFGLDAFGESVVVVDFERRRLRVYDALPAEAAEYDRLVAERTNGEWYVEADCAIGEKSHRHRFLLHSGYSGGVLLDDVFAAEIGANDRLPVIDETTLTDSFGNKIAVRKTVLPGLTLGRTRLSNVPAGFFPGNLGNQRISVIGGDVIKRFDLIFDLGNDAIYVRPRRDARAAPTTVP